MHPSLIVLIVAIVSIVGGRKRLFSFQSKDNNKTHSALTTHLAALWEGKIAYCQVENGFLLIEEDSIPSIQFLPFINAK